MEYRMIARDERVVRFLDHATVVPGRSGQAGFHHGFLLDIAERNALDAELAERTEQLERQKGYFESLPEISPVAIVTTDADAPLNAVSGMTELLLGTDLTDEQRELAGSVRTSGDVLRGAPDDARTTSSSWTSRCPRWRDSRPPVASIATALSPSVLASSR
jgi:hypothetical protein